jgi:acetyl-CoA carboxylase biotin carboxyl carrier protein
MNLEEIKELISVMRSNKIKEIDLEQEGSKVRIVAITPPSSKKAETSQQPAIAPQYVVAHPGLMAGAPMAAPMMASLAAESAAAVVAPNGEAAAKAKEPSRPGKEIKSPMVGTFYRAPAPGAPPYVDVGSAVGEETVICIIEAMKLMNEIKAEASGRIVAVLVENGQPVEFNQPLFLVEPI